VREETNAARRSGEAQRGNRKENVMGLGKRKSIGENMPVLKYDARIGRLYTQDRVLENGNWQTVQNDVTDNFEAIFDLKNIQVGQINFPKGAPPETKLVQAGEPIPDAPGESWKEGLRIIALLSDEQAPRELLSTAIAVWVEIDTLHDAYLKHEAEHPDEVPVVELVDVEELKTSTPSWQPHFEIKDWVKRPPSLPVNPAPRSEKPTATPAKAQQRCGDMDDEIPF
jgi:hypothetical protein